MYNSWNRRGEVHKASGCQKCSHLISVGGAHVSSDAEFYFNRIWLMSVVGCEQPAVNCRHKVLGRQGGATQQPCRGTTLLKDYDNIKQRQRQRQKRRQWQWQREAPPTNHAVPPPCWKVMTKTKTKTKTKTNTKTMTKGGATHQPCRATTLLKYNEKDKDNDTATRWVCKRSPFDNSDLFADQLIHYERAHVFTFDILYSYIFQRQ